VFRSIGLPELLVLCVIVGPLIVPAIFYLLTLQRALERCSQELRTMGLVLLLNIFAGPVTLVCWILYWVKIAGYARMLAPPLQPIAAGGSGTLG